MNVKLVAGVVVAAVVLALPHTQSAPLQPKPAPRWEFKVVFLDALGPKGKEQAAADRMASDLNAAANEGWDYVGPVAGKAIPQGGSSQFALPSGAFVLFKRERK